MMSVREIVWNVSKDAMTVTPNVPQRGGVQGEHNAVKVVFTIPEGCVLLGDGLKLYISCTDATGQYDKTEPLTVKEGRVEYPLPRAWTQYGGTDVLELTAEKDDQIIHSVKARVVFESRPTTKKGEKRLLEGFMQAACDAAEGSAEQAADSAEQAQEDKETAAAAANTAAAAADTATEAKTAAEQYAERAVEMAQDVAGDLAETTQHREAAEAAATNARQYAEDAGADAAGATEAAAAAKRYAEAAAEHDATANQHGAAAEEAAARADNHRKNAESAATNAAASASNAANSAEASRRYSQSAQEAATSALASAQMAAEAADKLSVDTELDAASNNPVANSAVAGAFAETNRRLGDGYTIHETEDHSVAISDESGNIVATVKPNGEIVGNFQDKVAREKLKYFLHTDKYAVAFCDEQGYVAYGTLPNGEKVGFGGVSGGGGSTIDLRFSGMPILYLDGDTSAMTKKTAVTLNYALDTSKAVYTHEHIASGTCECKWQGSSSVDNGYPKRNYTIKFITNESNADPTDPKFEATDAVSKRWGETVAIGEWGRQNKYCMKANWIDPSNARNVVCAKLWGEVVASRDNVPAKLKPPYSPNYGAIDGFPVIIVINGEFEGLYTFNIPKDGWMFGMGEGLSEYVVSGENNYDDACGFYNPATFVEDENGNVDFSVEYIHDDANEADLIASFKEAANAVQTAPESADWEAAVSPYFDIDSAIDYCIFTCCVSAHDNLRRNMLYATYDGVKWFMSAYDLDTTLGSNPYGTGLYKVTTQRTQFYKAANGEQRHRLFELIYKYSFDKLKTRYWELRNSVLSNENVWYVFNNFVNAIPKAIYNLDAERWADKFDGHQMPMQGTTTANVENYMQYYRMHTALLDKEMEE